MAKNLKKTQATAKTHEDVGTKSFFEKLFGMPANAVDWKREIIAGLSGLIGTAFVLFAFQRVLGAQYGFTNGVENILIVGTLIAMILSNLAQSIWARLPYIVTPSLGTLVILMPALSIGSFNVFMTIMLLEGIIFLTLSYLPFAKKLIASIPSSIKNAIVVSIGLVLIFMALSMSGIFGDHAVLGGNLNVEKLKALTFTNGIPSLSVRWLLDARTIVMVFGLILVGYFSYTKNKYTILITILLTAAAGVVFTSFHQTGTELSRITPIALLEFPADHSIFLPFGNWSNVLFAKTEFLPFLTDLGTKFMAFLSTFLILLAKDTIGTSASLIALGRQSGQMGENDETLHNSHKAMQVIGFNRIVSGLVGGMPADIGPESSIAVEADGRTSITPLIYAAGCALLLIGYNFFVMIPAIAVAPVLVMIGAGMLRNIGKIHWKDALEVIPAVTMMVIAALTFNIFLAVTLGVAMFMILRIAVWKFDDAQGGFWIIGLASLACAILYITTFMR